MLDQRVFQALFVLLISCMTTSAQSSSKNGTTYNTTITWYGTNDGNGSPNCNSNTNACGFYTFVGCAPLNSMCSHCLVLTSRQPGFAAAVSQNLYGAGAGQGSGPACGTCYRLTIESDQNGNRVPNAGSSIVVMVDNLCPATEDNPLCSQPDLQTPNQFGGIVNFNLCNDDGAHAALLTPAGTGLARGFATAVSCADWNGTKKTDCGSACNGEEGIDGVAGKSAVFYAWSILVPMVLMLRF